MLDTDLAWLAGIVDGEGAMSIERVTHNRGRTVCWSKYRLTVAMTHEDAVRRCQEITGLGTVATCDRSAYRGNKIFRWRTSGRQAGTVCQMLLPYLLVKRRHAEIIVLSLATMNQYGDSRSLSPEIMVQRELLLEELSILNRRGT